MWNKFKSFRAQNFDFQKFPQKYVTRNIPNFVKGLMICSIIAKITIYQVDIDLSDSSTEVFLQSSCKKVVIHRSLADSFNKFNSIPAFSFPNLKIFLWPMVVRSQFFACLIRTKITSYHWIIICSNWERMHSSYKISCLFFRE